MYMYQGVTFHRVHFHVFGKIDWNETVYKWSKCGFVADERGRSKSHLARQFILASLVINVAAAPQPERKK